MKKGDKLIWDHHIGFELCIFIKQTLNTDDMYSTVNVKTGIMTGKNYVFTKELFPYSKKLFDELTMKYDSYDDLQKRHVSEYFDF